ncbi:MAG: hypothetical protein ACREAW_04420 [Nitrososphaera sp.]
MSNSAIPVIAGLAVGVAFIMLFASVFAAVDPVTGKRYHLYVSIDGLEDSYGIGERIEFVVTARGYDHLCGFPNIDIVNADSGERAYTIQSFWLGVCDMEPRDVDEVWNLEDMGASEGIIIREGGNYKLMARYGEKTLEKEFSVTSNSIEVISLQKGSGMCSVCQAHSIFIFGNGTTIHMEYEREGSNIYIFQMPQNETARLFREFYNTDLSVPKADTPPATDLVYREMSFTDADGKMIKIFYRAIPSTPQTILELDLQIEQLVKEYDDRVVDCTGSSIRDCPVHEPKLDDDAETGLLIPDDDSAMDVGEPVELFEVNDNSTTVKIEYTED